jgi:SH3-like domain-containing protein
MLHSGTKIDVIEEVSGWKKIKIANGNSGWMKNEDVEKI